MGQSVLCAADLRPSGRAESSFGLDERMDVDAVDGSWGPTDQEGWRGCLSLPRELFLDESGRLCQRPAKEAAALYEHTGARGRILAGPAPQKLPAGDGNACCIRLSVKREGSRQLRLILMADENGNGTELTFDLCGHFLIADKNRMGNKWDKGLTVCTFGRRRGGRRKRAPDGGDLD